MLSREPVPQDLIVRDDDDIPSNTSTAAPFAAVLEARLNRRGMLGALGSTALLGVLGGFLPRGAQAAEDAPAPVSTLTFKDVPLVHDASHHVAEGYDAQVLIRWGDAVAKDAPAFDPAAQTAAAQAKQFGYNNDMIAFFPLPVGSQASDHGLLCINHEYTNTPLMFPGIADEDSAPGAITVEQAGIEIAAHGISVIEVKRTDGKWAVVPDSTYARRISLAETEFTVSGPVAGHDKLKTSADPTGTRVIGTINNCAGGWTPWGTYLSAEENFHQYFAGKNGEPIYKRYGVSGKPAYGWGRHVARFDIEKEPNEPNRFGWVVEVDPYDPAAKPIKRTALGHFKHENASSVISADGRLVVYSGDDERFEYVYRYVSTGKVNLEDRAANAGLLDDGVLSVARFNEDGTVTWLPLVHGQGPLTAENGFNSQADVLLETRRAADLLKPTPMDRPEDVEANPVTGRVYLMLTKNDRRTPDQVDAANQRFNNVHGHVIEMIPPGEAGAVDHTAETFTWDIFLRGGDPEKRAHGAKFGKGTADTGWFANPDNVAFDPQGRVWIATDGFPDFDRPDGLFAMDAEGEARGLSKRFFACPQGAEMCGPCFTPDGTTLFLAIQHPGEGDGSTFDKPLNRWPDNVDGMPPRPAIVVVTHREGKPIGT
ncbi:PhoX family protein [Zavarzinia sp. CC-PAN008]|uniref:PhoX family protein n=1 Tax=Zavarzinia sp. CC-PAN008 TaxID=3243332 RepID=UPI003F74774A